MNLYESIKNSKNKLTESVNGFIHVVWGPEASEDNLDDNERWELVGLVNSIENTEDEYNEGKLSLDDFIEIIEEECKAHGLSDEETKIAADFYRKSYTDDEPEDDEESFIMHNDNSDKDVRVWKQDGKWYDEEGNRYMGYLSKQDVKNYFKGNWHEVKESEDDEIQSKVRDVALDSESDYTMFDVVIGFAGYIGVEQEYHIQARNKDDAVFHALDELGSDAEQDLNVENVEDNGDGSYDIEVNFAGLESNTYTETASDQEEAENYALEDAKNDLEVISVDGEPYSYEDADGYVTNESENLKESYCILNYWDSKGNNTEKIFNANSPKSLISKVKRFVDNKCDPMNVISIHQASADVANDEYLNSLGDGVLRSDYFSSTFESEEMKENVGDKNDYSRKIKKLAVDFCKEHYGRLSTYFKGIEVESKTTPNAIKYKLTMDVVTNLSRVYDDVQELGDYISGHIPAVKFVKSDTYNITGSDLNEDLNLYFIQNTEFKDVGGDDVMKDAELKEYYDNPEPPEVDTIEVEGTVTITYRFTREIPKKWNYEQLLDDIEDNLSDYQDEVVDFEVDCSYEGPQDYKDRRADEQYDEERINND